MFNVIPCQPNMTFEQRERAISMLTTGMSARDVGQNFYCHESTISRLLNRFQETGNVADRPRSGRPRKSTPGQDCFLMISSQRSGFLSSWKLLSLCWYSADVTELSSLLLYHICNNITMGFSNMKMPVHTLQGIPRTFYASITSMCCSGLQDHWISLPLSTYGTT